MKNCDVAEFGSPVRAIAMVPGTFDRPAFTLCSDSIGDRRPRRLLLEVAGEAAALDHEAGDHAVELRAVVVLRLHVLEEVRDRLRRGVGVELDADRARGGVDVDLRIGGVGAPAANASGRTNERRRATCSIGSSGETVGLRVRR